MILNVRFTGRAAIEAIIRTAKIRPLNRGQKIKRLLLPFADARIAYGPTIGLWLWTDQNARIFATILKDFRAKDSNYFTHG